MLTLTTRIYQQPQLSYVRFSSLYKTPLEAYECAHSPFYVQTTFHHKKKLLHPVLLFILQVYHGIYDERMH